MHKLKLKNERVAKGEADAIFAKWRQKLKVYTKS
jgi:hypothetical protein